MAARVSDSVSRANVIEYTSRLLQPILPKIFAFRLGPKLSLFPSYKTVEVDDIGTGKLWLYKETILHRLDLLLDLSF